MQSVRGERGEHLECNLVTLIHSEHILISFLYSIAIQLFSALSLFVSLVKSYRFPKISSGLADVLNYF